MHLKPSVPTDVLWIGLNDRRNQMLFEWSDHSHVTFAQWQTGEPSHATNLQEDCVFIRGKVTPITVQTQKRCIKCCWWYEWPSGPYRTGGGLTTCVRSRMDTSVRRRPPLNQVKAPKRRPTQDASLWVMEFPLNDGCNYITKSLSDLVSQLLFFFYYFKGSIRFDSYCYNIGSEKKTFDDAKRACSEAGAYLVDVADR